MDQQNTLTHLILSRRIGETVIIDDNIEITLLNIQNNHVRIGINAPKETKIFREEIYVRIQAEKKEQKDVNTQRN